MTKISELKGGQTLDLGVLGTALVLGVTCVYPHTRALLAVRIGDSVASLDLPSRLEVHDE